MADKICEWCNEKYNGAKNSRWCKKPHYKTCDNLECNNTFIIKEMKRPAKTCSKPCADALTKINSTKEKVCQWHNCGKTFTSSKHDAMYCSNSHYDTCVVCKNEFEIHTVHKPAKTCSKKCAWNLVEDVESVVEKRKKSNQLKYGVDNPSQAQKIKDKKTKSAQKRYGVDNVSQAEEVKEKRVGTFIERYGADNPMRNKDIQETLRQSINDKYGVDNVFANEEIKLKVKQTILEKYGVENISQLPSNQDKVRATTLIRFGVESVLQLPENQLKASLANGKRISKINKKWKEILTKEANKEFKMETHFGDNYYADLGYDNVLIDINPTITHNSTNSFVHFTSICKVDGCEKKSHAPRDTEYHQKRALMAEENGYVLLQYFDWYDPEIFISIVKSKLKQEDKKVYARKTVLKEISQADANRFFRENHLMGASNGQTLCLGLFYNDELIHVQTYGKARLNKNYEWEAIRSASRINHHIPGAFSKCDKYFFNKMKPKSVISYVDLSISQGHTDSMFDGWVLKSLNKPSATWVRVIEDEAAKIENRKPLPRFVKDSAARRVSADRLLGFEVGEKYPRFDENGLKITNDYVFMSEGYMKVFDAGTRTYVWQ